MPILALNVDAEDNDIVAKLFQRTISELYTPKTSEYITLNEEIAEVLRSTPIYTEFGATMSLAKNGVLKWMLKSISHKPMTVHETKNKDFLIPNSPSSSVVTPMVAILA